MVMFCSAQSAGSMSDSAMLQLSSISDRVVTVSGVSNCW